MANTSYKGVEDTTLLIEIKLEGSDISDAYGIQTINVNHAINKISIAEIVLTGKVDIDSGHLAMSDSYEFDPGRKIEIFAGYFGTKTSSIFNGIIVKHIVRLDTETHYSYIIKCKHEAVKMTYNRTDRYFENKTDDSIIKSMIGNYNISCTVAPCSETNECSFQKMSTDWDFIIARCNFNGYIVTLDGNAGMVIDKPDFSTSAVLKIEAGISLMAFEGTLDAEFQPSEVTASAWDPQTLTLINATATEPNVIGQGKMKPEYLPSSLLQEKMNLVSTTSMTRAALQQWADGTLLRKRLNAFKGSAKYFGNALAKTGSIIEIKGVGKKLSGNAFVTGVTHAFDSGNWNTTVAFGQENTLIQDSPGFSYPPAMGQLPAMQGLQLATVMQIDLDPDNLHRIRLNIPSVSDTPNSTWARMANFYASCNAGSFFLPEIGDEVILGFLDNDPRCPVILGSLYNGKNAAPYTADSTNDIKALVTRSKMKIEFDEKKKIISLLTPGNNSIAISDDGKSIELKDQNSNSIKLCAEGIFIDSATDIKISAKGNITMDAMAKTTITSKADLTLSGLNVKAMADVGFKANGNATAELSASVQTVIKGAMVMIN